MNNPPSERDSLALATGKRKEHERRYFENAPSITALAVTNSSQQEILIRECDAPR